MKVLVMMSILAPFYSKRVLSECLCIILLLSLPLVWFSWELPAAATVGVVSDKLSSALVLLSLWTSFIMIMLKPSDKLLSLNVILLLGSLLSFFLVSSFVLFFIFFEAGLIPTLCLILGWGYQPERVEASYYFIFYTITFSMPLLVSLIWLISSSGSKYFHFDNLVEVCSGPLSFLILLVFMIKLPLFMGHLWLPKAHVEAPVVGSMILAGVLLKTGGYGIVRVFVYMSKNLVSLSFMTLSLLGMVYVCLICLYCMDLKQMIAFSSVSHMNFMVVGLMNNSLSTYSGSIVMMVSHGLCSSLMFMLADVSYKRCNSRSILLNKGFLMVMPTLSLLWGVTTLFNMGVPPTAGSISELLIISSVTKNCHWLFMMMFILYLFLSAFYSVYLYMAVNHGDSMKVAFTTEVKEKLLGVAHLLPLMGLTMKTQLLLL